MEKMKNVIFIDSDYDERKSALAKLAQYNYASEGNKKWSGVWVAYAIDDSSVVSGLESLLINDPTIYYSAQSFIEALEEFHKPKMRDMTGYEIIKAIAESEFKMVVNGHDIVEGFNQANVSDETMFYRNSVGIWHTLERFIDKYKLVTGFDDKTQAIISKPFEVEDK